MRPYPSLDNYSETLRTAGDMPAMYAHLEAQGNLIALARHQELGSIVGGGLRGNVTTFSRNSRLRMLRKMARLNAKNGVFLTLTYPLRHPDARTAKGHLRALLERFRRRYPQASAIWRLELQKRGAPHFHLIFFNLPFVPFREVRRWWAEITVDYVDEWMPRVKIEWIRSPNGVMYYAGKYCAKPDGSSSEGAVSQSLVSLSTTHICTLLASLLLLPSGLAHVPAYIYKVIVERQPSVGRQWGTFNEAGLPYAPHSTIVLEQVTAVGFGYAKDAMREVYPRVGHCNQRGAAIFTSGAYLCYEELLKLLVPDIPRSLERMWIGERDNGTRRDVSLRNRRTKDRIICVKVRHTRKNHQRFTRWL